MRWNRALVADARSHRLDYALGGLIALLAVVVLATRIDVDVQEGYQYPPETVLSYGLNIAVCLTVIGRRRWPLTSFIVGVGLFIVLEVGHHRDVVALIALLVGMYSVATFLPRWRALGGLVVLAVLLTVVILSNSSVTRPEDITSGLVLFLGAFVLGRLVRRRRRLLEARVAAADEVARAASERAQLQATAERLRMAQELHDIVAHSLSVIAVQAGVGVHLLHRQTSEAVSALDAISVASRTSLSELRDLVRNLRGDEPGELAPTPGLADLRSLAERVTTAGVRVRLAIGGDTTAVPDGAALAAYRITQEALTNVVRHAGAATANADISCHDDMVEVTVSDDGRGAGATRRAYGSSGGHGLVGMRERAALYGGEVIAGPRSGGGFQVHAVVPYGDEPRVLAAVETSRSSPAPSQPHGRRSAVPFVGDVLLAAVVSLLVALSIHQRSLHPAVDASGAVVRYHAIDWVVWVVALPACAALVVRRRWPLVVFMLTTAAQLLLAVGDYPAGSLVPVQLIAIYSVAAYESRARTVLAVVAEVITMAIALASDPPDLALGGTVWITIVYLSAVLVGLVVRRDRDALQRLAAAREDEAVVEARRAVLAAAKERLRIAQELHDVIAHSLMSIAVQADVGRRAIVTDADAAGEVLASISHASRSALADLRRLLGHLRADRFDVRSPARPAIWPPSPVLTR